MRRHVPVLKAVKTKLKELHTCPIFMRLSGESFPSKADTDEQIQRVINGMATKMRQHNQGGCHYIEAINEYIASPGWTKGPTAATGQSEGCEREGARTEAPTKFSSLAVLRRGAIFPDNPANPKN
jgi:hypothetical protein